MYDGASNITSWARTGWAADSQTYIYDGREQLATIAAASGTGTYTYDTAQNWTSYVQTGTTPFTVTGTMNANNQATQTVHSVSGTTTFGYDGSGNRTSKTLGAATDTYTYDADGNPTSRTSPRSN